MAVGLDRAGVDLLEGSASAIGCELLCRKPYMNGALPFGCGQCLPCRINRRRQWTWRQVFEGFLHEESSFVTLTYGPDYIPAGGNLRPRDLQLFLKRLRYSIGARKVRYVAVGEYGETTLRPHYHLSLFGLSGFTLLDGGRSGQDAIAMAWGSGHVGVGEFNAHTANYVAGYVVKKLVDRKSGALEGKVPEFGRMSRRPGIGADACLTLAKQICEDGHAMALLEETGDIPRELRLGKRKIPLGRFMLQKLRTAIGFTPEYIQYIKQSGAYEKSVEMSALLTRAFEAEENPTYKSVYMAESSQKILNVESRASVFRKRGSL